jgi:hypothetical protein
MRQGPRGEPAPTSQVRGPSQHARSLLPERGELLREHLQLLLVVARRECGSLGDNVLVAAEAEPFRIRAVLADKAFDFLAVLRRHTGCIEDRTGQEIVRAAPVAQHDEFGEVVRHSDLHLCGEGSIRRRRPSSHIPKRQLVLAARPPPEPLLHAHRVRCYFIRW